MKTILGLDPGRDKCGLAIQNNQGKTVYHQVVDAEATIAIIQQLCQEYAVDSIVMGDGTTCQLWRARLEANLTRKIPIATVNERNSTLEARDRYWLMYPPQGIQRLLPQGLRLPPRPIDDIVAILLIERYYRQQADSSKPSPF